MSPPGRRREPGPLLKKALARHRKGQLGEAEALYLRILKSDPRQFDALQLLGAIDLARGRHQAAHKRLESAITIDPGKPDVWCNLGLARRELGQTAAAEAAFRQALALAADFAMAHYHLGATALAAGDPAVAAGHLQESLRLQPTHYPSLELLADCDQRLGRSHQALALYQRMRALRPDDPDLLAALAACHQACQEPAAALEVLSRLVQLEPGRAAAWFALAECHEQLNDTDAALACARRARELDPHQIGALVLEVRALRRGGDLAAARELALQDPGADAAANVRAALQVELAQVLDALDDPSGATRALVQSNRSMLEYARDRGIDSKPSEALLARIEAWSGPVRGREQPGDPWTPVFFCGFPRSGTTLMEQVLNQVEGVTGSDEAPVLSQLAHALPAVAEDVPGYPAGLDALAGGSLESLRKAYRQAMVERCGAAAVAGVFVDKLPLNTWFLPLALRLFPTARVVFAVRDPRDVCLSCYSQLFEPNQTMVLFNQMDTTVRTYCRTLRLWRSFRGQLADQALEYRYEDLVRDFDATTRRVLDHLDLPWHAGLRDFHLAARRRGISTPSYAAVARPLNAAAVGRWRRYRELLAPYLADLQVFVDEYGYRA